MPGGRGHYLRWRAATVALWAAALGCTCTFADTAQAQKVHRLGYLTGSSEAARVPFLAAFRQGMRQHGYAEGRDFVLEARYANGNFERLPALAEELLRGRLDLLFVSTSPAALAAKHATAIVPIVFVGVGDPLSVGLVSNLARPGGNVTGISNIVLELTGKRLGLLKEIVPDAGRIAILVNPDDPNASIQLGNAREAARSLGLDLAPVLNVRRASDLEPAFQAATRTGAQAALRLVDPTSSILRAQTTALAASYRVPVMYAFREDVEAGGLAAYGTSLPAQYQQAASFVHRILRGAKPAELPIEQPTRFDFVINVKAAQALGLNVPPALLLQAEILDR